jgi:hypothetical protein
MNALETFLLDNLGFSWTWSKLFPYLFFPFLGFLIWLIFRKRIARKGLRYALLVVLITFPFGIYFAVSPIYEGDFSNDSVKVKLLPELKSNSTKLTVITIPGCRFCMESIQRMKEFKKRNPKLVIEYRVCSKDPDAVVLYKDVADGAFPVLLAEDADQLANVAGEAFPAFVMTDGNEAVLWSNRTFGLAAMDQVENSVK